MVAVVVAVVSVVAACSSDAPGTLGGSPPSVDWSGKTSAAPVAGDSSNVATDLAPSQIAGSTVPAPTTPEPCDVDDLELWTAQLIPGPSTVGAVIRIRNDGNVTCDVDIGRSPSVDPAIEFDVWLERGATADLIVGQRDVDCDDPVRVTAVEVAIRGELITVPSVLVTCGWWLTAFYPNDPARSACERDALDVAVVADAVIVRNGSEQPCAMGGIVEVAGAPVASENSPGPAIRELRPGDVVAFGRPVVDECHGTSRVELLDEAAGALVVGDVPCALSFELGGGRPWFGTAAGPPARLPAGSADEAAVVAALDPFAGDE